MQRSDGTAFGTQVAPKSRWRLTDLAQPDDPCPDQITAQLLEGVGKASKLAVDRNALKAKIDVSRNLVTIVALEKALVCYGKRTSATSIACLTQA